MLDNNQRREILDAAKAVDYQGSIMDLFAQGASGMNVPAMLHAQQEQQQQQMMTANTPQEQEVGLREQHAMGNTQASMAFPDVPPNASFNTEGMQVPMNISKFDQQGHLVQSFENVPPGVQDLPTGPARGTVVETPAYQRGGFDQSYHAGGLYHNINHQKQSGTSRSKAKSTISEDSYSDMQSGFKNQTGGYKKKYFPK